MTPDTRPAYIQFLYLSLTYRGNARYWAIRAAQCEADGFLDMYRDYAERATESEGKADVWLAKAFEVISGDLSDAEAREKEARERESKWR